MSNAAAAAALKEQANAMVGVKKYAKAIELYSQAIELDPTNHILYSNRAGALLEVGRFSESESDARKCAELKPDWAKGHYRLGQALENQGRHPEAVVAYRTAVELDAANPELQRSLERASKAASILADAAADAAPSLGDCVAATTALVDLHTLRGATGILQGHMTPFAATVCVERDADKGRKLVAVRPFAAGAEIFVDKCFAWYSGLCNTLTALIPAVLHTAPWLPNPIDEAMSCLAPFAPECQGAKTQFPDTAHISSLRHPIRRVEYVGRICRVNALPATWNDTASDISGTMSVLSFAASMINHSCTPCAAYTAHWDHDARCPVVRVYALRDIAVGEEITLSYVTTRAAKPDRAKELDRYRFTCTCSRCTATFDDTVINKCPACHRGRLFGGATACADCSTPLPPDVLERVAALRATYVAKPRKLADLVFTDDFESVPVHLHDADRLNMIYSQLGAAWALDASESDRLYDTILPAFQANGTLFHAQLPQLYLLGGHCAAIAHQLEKALTRYQAARDLYAIAFGPTSYVKAQVEELIAHPLTTKSDIEKFELRRLEGANWVKADRMPMKEARRMAHPVDSESLAALLDRHAPTSHMSPLREELTRVTRAIHAGQWVSEGPDST